MADEAGTDLLSDPFGILPNAARNEPRLAYHDSAGAHEAAVPGKLVLGSSPDTDIVGRDQSVSRIHCELDPRDDGLWVQDLGSRNGTYVDGVFVRVARLGDGARLRVGSTDVLVRYDPTPTKVPLWPLDRFGPLVGRSVAMRELFARLERIAQSDASVLVMGETGTGKELVARAIHQVSPRQEEPFVIVDCGSIPENLIEAELFGHAKGAFTGATESRVGALEAANRGTVFLDEIGELPLAMQPKLLRFLESRTVRPIGRNEARTVDVRVISATHRDLRTMVNRGAFREDLYFRLAVLPVTLPSLRDRIEDLPLLMQHFAPAGASVQVGSHRLAELRGRPWEGNVRELRNFVERLLALGADEAMALFSGEQQVGAQGLPVVPLDVPFKLLRERWLEHLERQYLQGLLERHDRSITAVAEAAGIDRTYVHRLMRKHGL